MNDQTVTRLDAALHAVATITNYSDPATIIDAVDHTDTHALAFLGALLVDRLAAVTAALHDIDHTTARQAVLDRLGVDLGVELARSNDLDAELRALLG